MISLALSLELLRWRAAGRRARLWWRDDDADRPSAELDWLLRVAGEAGVPLTLAVVPCGDAGGDLEGLAAALGRATHVNIVQHGTDHRNRRTGPAAGEYPHDWSRGQICAALRRGRRDLQGLAERLEVFVPPWNDVHPQLEAALADCGYQGWSAAGGGAGQTPPGALPRLDVHLDLMRWRNGARFRGAARVLDRLARELRTRRRRGDWAAPIGLLTHHMAHDAEAWDFLARFVAWSAAHPALSWVSLPALLDEAATTAGRQAALEAPGVQPRARPALVAAG